MAYLNSILETIGNTPMVKVNKLNKNPNVNLLLKLEGFNPGGSVKDRPAYHIIATAEERKLIKPGDTIVESSSGNFGVALAMIGAAKGYRVIILVDPRTPKVNLAMLKAYNAEIIMVTEKDGHGGYQGTRIAKAKELSKKLHAFLPFQYNNPLNPEAHYCTTAKEILQQCDNKVDAIIIAVSTAGQISGIGQYFKKLSPKTLIVAVDAVGSTIFGGQPKTHLITGIGLSGVPGNLNMEVIDKIYKVTDEAGFDIARKLASSEGILIGGSGGAVLYAAMKYSEVFGRRGDNIVAVMPDSGEKYLDNFYSDAWLSEKNVNLSDISKKQIYEIHKDDLILEADVV